jgi:uncharacterized membrane protein
MPSSEYKIEIYREQDSSTITYFKLSPKRGAYNSKDSIRLNELLNKKWRTAEENQEYDKIYNKYKVFEKDSLKVTNKEMVIKYTDSLINNEKAILNEKNSQPIYMDAMEVIVTNNDLKRYSVYNPSRNNYTLIFLLLKESLSVYRKRDENPILSKCYTGNL